MSSEQTLKNETEQAQADELKQTPVDEPTTILEDPQLEAVVGGTEDAEEVAKLSNERWRR